MTRARILADYVAGGSTAAEFDVLDGLTSTTAELNHVDGVTSNVQTQLNAKAPLASPTFTGTVTSGDGTTDQYIDLKKGDSDKHGIIRFYRETGLDWSIGESSGQSGDPYELGGGTGFAIWQGSSPSAKLSIDSSGRVIMPYQPAFSAHRSTTGQAIASTAWTTCVFNTERFDIGSNYNTSTGIFTAPVTGKYQINCTARIDGLSHTSAHSSIQLNTSNTNYSYQAIITPTSYDSELTYHSLNLSCLVDMDANDTALITAFFNGSTGTLADYTGCTFNGVLVS